VVAHDTGEKLHANPMIFARINKAHATNELRRSLGVEPEVQKPADEQATPRRSFSLLSWHVAGGFDRAEYLVGASQAFWGRAAWAGLYEQGVLAASADFR
jgi:hypothetical protein